MHYIVFDLEWNQPGSPEETVREPVYLSGEIIEIGAVKLSEKFETLDEIRIFIKPQFYVRMHHAVAALTKISNNTLKNNGIPFREAYEQFLSWCGEDYSFMTWSESDLEMLIENMLVHRMDVSCFPTSYDIQRIFDREIMREDHQCSLDRAIEILGESGDRAHDALHDARNTVLVCNHLDLDTYLEEYATRAFGETPSDQIYPTINDTLHSEENWDFLCPWCGGRVRIEGWIQMNSHRFMAMGTCGEEDEYILYLNLTRCPGGYRASRVLYEMSDDLWDRYEEKVESRQLIPLEPALPV